VHRSAIEAPARCDLAHRGVDAGFQSRNHVTAAGDEAVERGFQTAMDLAFDVACCCSSGASEVC
jgi:hypothetical protein